MVITKTLDNMLKEYGEQGYYVTSLLHRNVGAHYTYVIRLSNGNSEVDLYYNHKKDKCRVRTEKEREADEAFQFVRDMIRSMKTGQKVGLFQKFFDDIEKERKR